MKVSTVFPDLTPADIRSALPPGGSPAADQEYLSWVAGFIEEVAPAVLDRLTDDATGEVLGRPDRVINTFKLTQHLFKWILGWEFPSGTGPSFSHRLRFVSVQFKLRGPALMAEADAYVEREVAAIRVKATAGTMGS
jgi:hypothetical protein